MIRVHRGRLEEAQVNTTNSKPDDDHLLISRVPKSRTPATGRYLYRTTYEYNFDNDSILYWMGVMEWKYNNKNGYVQTSEPELVITGSCLSTSTPDPIV